MDIKTQTAKCLDRLTRLGHKNVVYDASLASLASGPEPPSIESLHPLFVLLEFMGAGSVDKGVLGESFYDQFLSIDDECIDLLVNDCKDYREVLQVLAYLQGFPKTTNHTLRRLLALRESTNEFAKIPVRRTKTLVNCMNETDLFSEKGLDLITLKKRPRICANCHREDEDLVLKCGACRVVYYCDVDCQKRDWSKSHKKYCQLLNRVYIDIEK